MGLGEKILSPIGTADGKVGTAGGKVGTASGKLGHRWRRRRSGMTKFLSCHFLALEQFHAKSKHSMERSDILLYENHLSFVEILFIGPKFKGKEGYPIAD